MEKLTAKDKYVISKQAERIFFGTRFDVIRPRGAYGTRFIRLIEKHSPRESELNINHCMFELRYAEDAERFYIDIVESTLSSNAKTIVNVFLDELREFCESLVRSKSLDKGRKNNIVHFPGGFV